MRQRNKTSFDPARSKAANEKRWAKARLQRAEADRHPLALSQGPPSDGELEPTYGRDADAVVDGLWAEAASSTSAIGRINALKELRQVYTSGEGSHPVQTERLLRSKGLALERRLQEAKTHLRDVLEAWDKQDEEDAEKHRALFESILGDERLPDDWRDGARAALDALDDNEGTTSP